MKLPLELIQTNADLIASQRECGECTACCVLPRIPIGEDPDFPDGKPGYTPCQHLCSSLSRGCGIYDKRPQLCKDYQCLWRAGIIQGDDRRRPDNLGLMFTLDKHEGEGVIDAWELWPGAAENTPGRWVIDSIDAHARVHIRFYGVPAALYYESSRILVLGRALSQAAQHHPQELAKYLSTRVETGDLTANNLASVMRDLDALRAGQTIPQYYRPK